MIARTARLGQVELAEGWCDVNKTPSTHSPRPNHSHSSCASTPSKAERSLKRPRTAP